MSSILSDSPISFNKNNNFHNHQRQSSSLLSSPILSPLSSSPLFFNQQQQNNNNNNNSKLLHFYKIVEIVALALQYLPLADVVICCRVSKLWSDICRNILLPRKTVDFLDPQSRFRIRHNISLAPEFMSQVLAVQFDSKSGVFRVVSKNQDSVSLSIHTSKNSSSSSSSSTTKINNTENGGSSEFIPPDPVRLPLINFYKKKKSTTSSNSRRRGDTRRRTTEATTTNSRNSSEQQENDDEATARETSSSSSLTRRNLMSEDEDEIVDDEDTTTLDSDLFSPKHNFVFAQITDDVIILDHYGFWLKKMEGRNEKPQSSSSHTANLNKSNGNNSNQQNDDRHQEEQHHQQQKKRFDYADEDEERMMKKFSDQTSLCVSGFDLRRLLSRIHPNAIVGATHAVNASKIFVCHDGKLSIIDVTGGGGGGRCCCDSNVSSLSSFLKFSIKLDTDPIALWSCGLDGRFLIVGFSVSSGTRLQVFDVLQEKTTSIEKQKEIEKSMNEKGYVDFEIDDEKKKDENDGNDSSSNSNSSSSSNSSTTTSDEDDDDEHDSNLDEFYKNNFKLDQFEFRLDQGVVPKRQIRKKKYNHHHHNHSSKQRRRQRTKQQQYYDVYHFKCIANATLNTSFRLAVGNKSLANNSDFSFFNDPHRQHSHDLFTMMPSTSPQPSLRTSHNNSLHSSFASSLDDLDNLAANSTTSSTLSSPGTASSSFLNSPIAMTRGGSTTVEEFFLKRRQSSTAGDCFHPSSSSVSSPTTTGNYDHFPNQQQQQQVVQEGNLLQRVFTASAIWCAVSWDSKLIVWDLSKQYLLAASRKSNTNKRKGISFIPFASRKPIIRSLVADSSSSSSSSGSKKRKSHRNNSSSVDVNNNSSSMSRNSSSHQQNYHSNFNHNSSTGFVNFNHQNAIHVVDLSIIEKSFCVAVVVQKLNSNHQHHHPPTKRSTTTGTHHHHSNNNNNNTSTALVSSNHLHQVT